MWGGIVSEPISGGTPIQFFMMPGKGSIRILSLLLVLLAGGIVTAASAAAPYSFSVSPEHAEAAPGSSVEYTITITASPAFSDPISFTMDESSFGISRRWIYQTRSLDVGTSRGPYPQTIFYTLEVPREAPPGVTVKATVTGTSGSDQVTQDLDIKVKGQGGILETLLGTIIDKIPSVIDKILSALGMGK
jgi:hypothetical protein